jgi:hypothetical protein
LESELAGADVELALAFAVVAPAVAVVALVFANDDTSVRVDEDTPAEDAREEDAAVAIATFPDDTVLKARTAALSLMLKYSDVAIGRASPIATAASYICRKKV